ncbi:MAG: SDR family oxidoreductase [Myxococcales bacterium]|nr:SDR family oxidoreductase [Myxococcales bacterium]
MSSWRLDGKTALVTGGSKGIGRAVVDELVALGAHVIVVARSQAGIDETLAAHPGKVTGIAADVTSAAGRARIVGAAPATLDVLVHNAGGNIRRPLTGYDDETIAQIVSLNLLSPLSLSRELHGRLVAAGQASVIHVGSVAGIIALGTGVAYGAAKAGLAQATRTLALEWASTGIRVNTVAPWYTRTDLVAPVLAQPKRLEAILARTPLGRVAEPVEVARAIVFLALPAASYITGQCLAVDGGMSIQGLPYAP